MPKPLAPWWEIPRPHPRSSGFSRFRANVPVLSATAATPTALNVYQARCEVEADDINTPIRIVSHFSSTETILAISSMGGWKDRTPFLQYIVNTEPAGRPEKYTTENSFSVGLAGIAHHTAIDPSRKLLFTGDSDRVKSFEWGRPGTEGGFHKKAEAVHTFDSDGFDGPMLVLGDGRFIRAGNGKMGVWNLNELAQETHAMYGKKPIGGRKINVEDTWRDDPEAIDRARGTAVGQTMNLWIPNLKPAVMKHHPSGTPNLVLFGAEFDEGNLGLDPRAQYSCVILDIEQGKPVSKILGHGDSVTEFSTSSADPNAFVTGCEDGYARLFDVRTHFPVITFDAAYREEACSAVALAHPDGIPSLFTGLESGEHIKFWDIRAKAVVYDLGTGNNAVGSIAWDERKQVLYAATACHHITRHGGRMDYRKLKVPRPPKSARDSKKPTDGEDQDMGDDEDEGDWEDVEDDEDELEDLGESGDDGQGWPKKAQHAEDYYPHLFDAASHRLFRYSFKTEPSPDVLPQNDW
ncbi:WD40 repeat-like protein [Pluteus cervinus]|uniref:WD40 repeat-like protein n=1 Tax=Pluteus cervinus TaxID=181527 RepID=A0ACD3BBT1_9AGAR|nr:WD40 repeat-like protein [Pluteus cervinus]